jgi:hypothetical protein
MHDHQSIRTVTGIMTVTEIAWIIVIFFLPHHDFKYIQICNLNRTQNKLAPNLKNLHTEKKKETVTQNKDEGQGEFQ